MILKQYNAGDKVLISMYDPSEYYVAGFVTPMKFYSGKIMTIEKVYSRHPDPKYTIYILKEDNSYFYWSGDMFTPISQDTNFINLKSFVQYGRQN